MYKNEDQFVRGQKIKLGIIGIILAYLLLHHFFTGAPILN